MTEAQVIALSLAVGMLLAIFDTVIPTTVLPLGEDDQIKQLGIIFFGIYSANVLCKMLIEFLQKGQRQ